MADKIIYLDNAATTIPYKEVLESYNKASTSYFANASSIHKLGQESARLVELSRKQILDVIGLNKTHDLVFTSGATEANNLAIIGYCLKFKNRGNHIITTVYEHPSILETFEFLKREFNFEVTYLNVNENGVVDVDNLLNQIRDNTILVSIMAVNNEIGSINPIEEIATKLKKYNKIAFHTDAVQAIGKIDINYKDVDMITITSHKIHGPKGVGCLIKKNSISLTAINNGGGQEKGERSGTMSTELIACFSKALKLTVLNMKKSAEKVKLLKQKVEDYVLNNADLYEINSSKENPFILNFSLKNRKASVVVEALSNANIMISSISACHSHGEQGSYVVKALGKNEQLSRNTLRISFDENNTMEDIETFIATLDKIIREVKQ